MFHSLNLRVLLILLGLFLCTTQGVYAIEPDQTAPQQTPTLTPENHEQKSLPKYQYTYINRRHSLDESLRLIAAMYGVTWAIYPLTQPTVVRDKGSWSNYKDNFGKLVFDKDEPFWNWFVHPISGSQLYLFYRANGYNRINAMGMAFISSALFEFTVEIYTEPASVQDLYQTPVLGAFLGVGLEHLSLYLLHSGNTFFETIGHIINPSTMFWYFEGKIQVVPTTNFRNSGGLLMTMDF